MKAPILISILNWNGLPDTLACLAALAAGERGLWDVVLIDNGSTTDPRAAVAAAFPSIEVILLPENKGFASGQNHGMRLAMARGYESVLLLNNDCEISADAIGAMLAQLRANPNVAALSPLLYSAEQRDKPQMVSAWLDWDQHRSERPSRPEVATPPGLPTMLPGTALLLRCAALEEIGLLDERYFAYYEDNDMSARIAAHGMLAQFCPSAIAWHSSRAAHEYSAMALYLSARNAWLFWRSHTPRGHRAGMFRHLLAQSLVEIAALKTAGAHAKCDAVVAGFWDAQWRRFGAPPAQLRSPWLLRRALCVAPYLAYELLTRPVQALRARLRLG